MGLKIFLDLGEKFVEIMDDSELVVEQLTKEYKCIKENLIVYFATANALMKRFDHANIQHIPRIENQEANDLAQVALGYKVSREMLKELIEVKEKLTSTEEAPSTLSMSKFGGGGGGRK